MTDFTAEIKGRTLEYIDDDHVYLVDGVQVPSITQILNSRYGHKYDFVNKEVLRKAAEAGTAVHDAIEMYCRDGTESDLPEVEGFKTLLRQYGFLVIENEVPVILFDGDEPIAAGRVDMVLKMDGQIGGADIKRTSSLDKEYLTYQLNLYRVAYYQSYGIEWEFLRGIHLRNEVRQFVQIPINDELPWESVNQYIFGGQK